MAHGINNGDRGAGRLQGIENVSEVSDIWGQQQRQLSQDDGPEELKTTTESLAEEDNPKVLTTTMEA